MLRLSRFAWRPEASPGAIWRSALTGTIAFREPDAGILARRETIIDELQALLPEDALVHEALQHEVVGSAEEPQSSCSLG